MTTIKSDIQYEAVKTRIGELVLSGDASSDEMRIQELDLLRSLVQEYEREKSVGGISKWASRQRQVSIYNGLSGKNLFFISDTHFFHPNIIRYCNRPFNSVEEMNETLIRNWNEVVPPDGRVFHLGDFAFGGDAEWRSVLSRLNGKIYLILGNHDIQNVKSEVMDRFEAVTQQMLIGVDGQKIILNHYPLLAFGGSYHNIWQLFGHVHSGPYTQTAEESTRGKDIPRLVNLFPTQYDVGVDNNEFRPVPFARLKKIIETQVEGSNRK